MVRLVLIETFHEESSCLTASEFQWSIFFIFRFISLVSRGPAGFSSKFHCSVCQLPEFQWSHFKFPLTVSIFKVSFFISKSRGPVSILSSSWNFQNFVCCQFQNSSSPASKFFYDSALWILILLVSFCQFQNFRSPASILFSSCEFACSLFVNFQNSNRPTSNFLTVSIFKVSFNFEIQESGFNVGSLFENFVCLSTLEFQKASGPASKFLWQFQISSESFVLSISESRSPASNLAVSFETLSICQLWNSRNSTVPLQNSSTTLNFDLTYFVISFKTFSGPASNSVKFVSLQLRLLVNRIILDVPFQIS